MIRRESVRTSALMTKICWGTSGLAWTFVADLMIRGDDRITSRQWQYLMSVPGGNSSWAALFGVGAALLTLGTAATNYACRGAGLFALFLGCLLIAVFYIVMPLIEPGLSTLGFYPWLMAAWPLLMMAAANWFSDE